MNSNTPIARRNTLRRPGGVYIAVLGTSMIVALLGLAALIGQRIQNQILVAAADTRQAQLNAFSAVELALAIMKQDANWRTAYSNGPWFSNRNTGAGSCSLSVVDPADSNLADNADDPVVVLGVGFSGQAQQRLEITIDPRRPPLACLRSAIAVGDDIDLQSDTLRTDGLITADQVAASSSLVYGEVQAAAVSGSTYAGTTTVVTSDKRPDMPDWTSVFAYYRTQGTEISIANVPQTTPNLGRNTSFDFNANYWTGSAPGLPSATVTRETNFNGHAASLRVSSRGGVTSGPSQYIDHFVKPGVTYNIAIEVCPSSTFGNFFRVKLATKGSGSVQTSVSPVITVLGSTWTSANVNLTAPSWSGPLEYARITVDTDYPLGSNSTFYIDNLDVREATTGRYIYRQLLSPSSNPFGGQTNSQGIYWINCQGNRLMIERSRILGTLLLINPGANSCVSEGPIHWSPAVPGYPALLVDADNTGNANFSLRATSRPLNEDENNVNFNPAGTPYDFANTLASATDNSANDIYPSEIRGLVAVRNNLTFENNPLVRGQIIVGGDIGDSSGELDVQFLPEALLNPPPGFLAPYSYFVRPASARKVVQ